MSQPVISVDPASLDSSTDLQTILAAWHTATLRLEQTHDALRRRGPPDSAGRIG